MTRFRDARQRLLVRLARDGHTPSFRRLYRELSGPVLRYLTSRLDNAADAEDVASEVFQRFVTRLDQYDPARGSVQAWVFRMARNRMIDHLRRIRRMDALDDIVQTLADGSPDGLSRMLADEEARFASGLLRQHPPEVREMFALHFAHGLSYREIAVMLGLSEAAVKQRFARTMRDLRQRLQTERRTPDMGNAPDVEGAGG
jgi:RNA polymerase sigma-70 factor (ECF subfamily)